MSESQSQPNDNSILLQIKSQGNLPELTFKTKLDKQFEKMFDTYYKRSGAAQDSIRFIFDGQRLNGNQTPKELDMQDNDIIDAVIQQVGGYIYCY